MSGMIQDVARE